ncbi:hypothetical protein AEM51_03665 [Bacteroidetes bacterium UKL13-3]|nr:hypothetical protein AEM51_03665 [Bacteroidetes bacterium UKL13-3]HCP94714.1 hypothetical protein [Bacteroidota bacterium]
MLTICNYHYIRNSFENQYPSIFGVTQEQFDNQIRELGKTYSFITLEALQNDIQNVLSSDINFMLITFDDGLKEQYEYALPILNMHKIPAYFFINTINHIERKVSAVHKIHLVRSVISPDEIIKLIQGKFGRKITALEKNTAQSFYHYDDPANASVKYLLNIILNPIEVESFIDSFFCDYFDEEDMVKKLYMNQDEIINLAKLGYIGSHTHSHLPLALYSENRIISELKISKKYLETLCNEPIISVAYPYGKDAAINDKIGDLAHEEGYQLGFTTITGTNTTNSNLLLLNRYDCNDLPGGKNYSQL